MLSAVSGTPCWRNSLTTAGGSGVSRAHDGSAAIIAIGAPMSTQPFNHVSRIIAIK